MRILGIDPGSIVTGVAVLDVQASRQPQMTTTPTLIYLEALKVKSATAPLGERLRFIKAELDRIFLATKPTEVAVERIFFGKNADSAFKLGHARGVCILAAAENNVPVSEYAAKSVKKMVTGSGSADKLNVQVVLRQMFALPPDCPWDASDALAVALTHSLYLQNPLLKLSKSTKMDSGVEL
jgi:crossover junction endodeoxyribonuclease RuvC